MAKAVSRSLRDFKRRGVAAVEFALMLPFLVILLLGTFDCSTFLLANAKVDRIAYSVTDIVSQYKTVSLANLADITLAASQLMLPISFSEGKGVVIISSVYKETATSNTVICWQYMYPMGQSVHASKIGSTGGVASLPNGLTLNANDNLIVAEVYYDFKPVFGGEGVPWSGTLYKTAAYKPRLSPLITPPQ